MTSLTPQSHQFAAACELEIVHGRSLPTNTQYTLPIDKEEHDRLDIQHEVQKRTIGGLYAVPELVEEVLAPMKGVVKRILDVGTGSGAWAVDMAKKFPSCDIIGIDLVPPASLSTHPPNLQFKAADANFPLPLETASIDMIHVRLVDQGIGDYPKWLSEVARLLRPSGLYLVTIGTSRLIGEDGSGLPDAPVGEVGYTGIQSILSGVGAIEKSRAGGILPSDRWITLMKQNGHFDRMARINDMLLPIGPWHETDENTRVAGELMRRNILAVIRSMRPILLKDGWEDTLVDKWIKDAEQELSEQLVKVSVRYLSAWCTRSADKWGPN